MTYEPHNTSLLRRALAAVLGLAFLISSAEAADGGPKTPTGDKAYADSVRPLLQKYCFSCHEGAKAKGSLRLDKLGPAFTTASAPAWKEVKDRLANRLMPPPKSPQPTPDETRTITAWIEGQLAVHQAVDQKAQGRVVLRRLNRVEYQNTLSDLLGIPLDVKEILPEDTSAEGFDNVGAALHVSSVQMQRYLEAADTALTVFFAGGGPEPKMVKARYSYLKERFASEPAPARTITDDAVVLFAGNPGEYTPFELRQFSARHEGLYRFRMGVHAFKKQEKPLTMAVYGGRSLIGYFDVSADPENVVEFTVPLRRNQTIKPTPYRLNSGLQVAENRKMGRGLALRWVEVEGPLHECWPPLEYSRLLGRVDLKMGKAADAERILHSFATRAFRRPVARAELQPFLAVFHETFKETKQDAFETALRAGMTAVLCSPHFLFLMEKPGTLDSHALASRLSYFFWSTMPDQELARLADEGRLRERAELHRQVERLLQSPRASAFTENFLGQWLELRHIEATTPDRNQYPQFDELLKNSMLDETHAFFEELLKNDLSTQNFVDSKFAMLNRPLANLYGVRGVEGLAIRRVELPPGSHRGGLLTQASILKITANGTSTSPITRGVWVLKNVLGTPPPPPPPNVPAVEPDVRGATTMRELLAKHRKIETCAGCHRQIDPAGFALENFDVIGAWRDNYRTTDKKVNQYIEVTAPDGRLHKYRKGPKVDAADALADGRSFQNIDDLKRLLLGDPEQVPRCVAEKLAIYATGATLGDADRAVLNEIVQRSRARQYGLRTLIHELVQSPLFLNK